MEEKLNEILEKSELKIVEWEKERDEINHRIQFLKQHGFEKELEWLRHRKESMIDIFLDYRNAVEEIRGLLNMWNA